MSIRRRGPRAELRRALTLVVLTTPFFACAGCGSSSSPASPLTTVVPMWADDDGDGVDDYVERAAHDPGPAGAQRHVAVHGPGMSGPGMGAPVVPGAHAGPGHAFVDENDDGICDYAQNGSDTWHGPGWIDDDGDGVCDYWQPGSPHHGMGGGMQFVDMDHDGVDDYVEPLGHAGMGHDFIDRNGDGICDLAQTGGPGTWHGPGAADSNHDGMPDVWAPGMPGHGGMMGGG